MFNEMKGVYSSPDSMFYRTVQQVGVLFVLCVIVCYIYCVLNCRTDNYTCTHTCTHTGFRGTHHPPTATITCSSSSSSCGSLPSTGLIPLDCLPTPCDTPHHHPWCLLPSTQALFPDNTYSHDSGGDPTVIPSLTFEQFQVCARHMRAYCCNQDVLPTEP